MYQAAGHAASIETCVQYLMISHEGTLGKLGAKVALPPMRPKAGPSCYGSTWRRPLYLRLFRPCQLGRERKGDPNGPKNTSGGPGARRALTGVWTGCEEHGIVPG